MSVKKGENRFDRTVVMECNGLIFFTFDCLWGIRRIHRLVFVLALCWYLLRKHGSSPSVAAAAGRGFWCFRGHRPTVCISKWMAAGGWGERDLDFWLVCWIGQWGQKERGGCSREGNWWSVRDFRCESKSKKVVEGEREMVEPSRIFDRPFGHQDWCNFLWASMGLFFSLLAQLRERFFILVWWHPRGHGLVLPRVTFVPARVTDVFYDVPRWGAWKWGHQRSPSYGNGEASRIFDRPFGHQDWWNFLCTSMSLFFACHLNC